ncbi:MAG: heavy metal sensor signal transduction histidine [Planctomycetota bacterium]|nr:MAG: heavy metal sensor signal transduction histidine [Planctomycetota bacterium]
MPSTPESPQQEGKRRRSLAVRLSFWYAGSSFAVVLVVIVACYFSLALALQREDDEFLRDRLDQIRARIQLSPGDPVTLREEIERGAGSRESEPLYLRAISPAGAVYETPGASTRLDPAVIPAPPFGPADITSLDERQLRVSTTTFSEAAGVWTLHGILDRGRDEQFTTSFRHFAIIIAALSLLACALAGDIIARAGMRPVRDMAATAEHIRSTSLGERIPMKGLPSELYNLASTFNAMLDRLQRSFDQISRFSADIAHELRTPLMNLRTTAEVALGRDRTAPEYAEVLASCLEEAERLTRIVDSLLFLARAEADRTKPQAVDLDVAGELAAMRDYHVTQAEESGVALAVDCPAPLPARVDRTLFQRAVSNLVTNAFKYTPKGGTITMRGFHEPGRLVIQVRDTGAGISAEHLSKVFDRFYRADTARNSRMGGTGLGLAIVKSVAALHGGEATIDSTPGKGTTVTLTFPQEAAKGSG